MWAPTKNSVGAHAKACDWKSENRVVERLGNISRNLPASSILSKDAGSGTSSFRERSGSWTWARRWDGEKEDGGISQGISGISPRGGLVNCSVDTGGKKWGRERERERGRADVWVYRLRGQKWVLRKDRGWRGEETDERQRERGHKSRQSYGLKEAYQPIAVIRSCGCICWGELRATPSARDKPKAKDATFKKGRIKPGYSVNAQTWMLVHKILFVFI